MQEYLLRGAALNQFYQELGHTLQNARLLGLGRSKNALVVGPFGGLLFFFYEG